jgi:hypothetical protein
VSTNNVVTVISARKTMNVDINGDNQTISDTLAEFFGISADDVADHLADEGLGVRMNSRDVTDSLDGLVRGGDVILPFPTNIIAGGVKAGSN